MASLDEISRTVFQTRKPPLGLLAAACCARTAAIDLSPEDQAPFAALSEAVLAFWPAQKRSPADIYEREFTPCLVLSGAPGSERLRLAMDAAQLEMAALLHLTPKRLPGDGLYGIGEEHLVRLVRNLAKKTHTDLELWKARLEHLMAGATAPWEAQVASAARMGFGRPMRALRDLPEPLRALGRIADLGATSSWSAMGPKHALKLELGTQKRTAVLDDAQRETLIAALPWLA